MMAHEIRLDGSAVIGFAFSTYAPGSDRHYRTGFSQRHRDPWGRLFQQNCSVCHTQATLTNPMYGPSLYRDIVNGKEEAMRDFIGKGSSKMPGFRYGLKASEINAIVEYLKTVPKPAPRSPQTKGEGPVD